MKKRNESGKKKEKKKKWGKWKERKPEKVKKKRIKKKKWKSELESNIKVITSKHIKIHPKETWKTEICIIVPPTITTLKSSSDQREFLILSNNYSWNWGKPIDSFSWRFLTCKPGLEWELISIKIDLYIIPFCLNHDQKPHTINLEKTYQID